MDVTPSRAPLQPETRLDATTDDGYQDCRSVAHAGLMGRLLFWEFVSPKRKFAALTVGLWSLTKRAEEEDVQLWVEVQRCVVGVHEVLDRESYVEGD